MLINRWAPAVLARRHAPRRRAPPTHRRGFGRLVPLASSGFEALTGNEENQFAGSAKKGTDPLVPPVQNKNTVSWPMGYTESHIAEMMLHIILSLA